MNPILDYSRLLYCQFPTENIASVYPLFSLKEKANFCCRIFEFCDKMMRHSDFVSGEDAPEAPFTPLSIDLNEVSISNEMTPDGVQNVVQLLQTTAIEHVTPPSDSAPYPEYLKVFEVVYQGELKAVESHPLSIGKLRRPAHYSRLFCYKRPNFLVRLDVRLPIGENLQIKAYAKPGNFPAVAGDEKNYPGVLFWLADTPTLYFRINYSLPNYGIINNSDVVSTFCFSVISSVTRSTNPQPIKFTLSMCIPELQPSVPQMVDDIGAFREPAIQDVYVGAQQVARDEKTGKISFWWTFFSVGVGLITEGIFPGSGPVVKAGVDFIVYLVARFAGRASPQYVMSVPCSSVFYTHEDENGWLQVGISADGPWYYPYQEDVRTGEPQPIVASNGMAPQPIQSNIHQNSRSFLSQHLSEFDVKDLASFRYATWIIPGVSGDGSLEDGEACVWRGSQTGGHRGVWLDPNPVVVLTKKGTRTDNIQITFATGADDMNYVISPPPIPSNAFVIFGNFSEKLQNRLNQNIHIATTTNILVGATDYTWIFCRVGDDVFCTLGTIDGAKAWSYDSDSEKSVFKFSEHDCLLSVLYDSTLGTYLPNWQKTTDVWGSDSTGAYCEASAFPFLVGTIGRVSGNYKATTYAGAMLNNWADFTFSLNYNAAIIPSTITPVSVRNRKANLTHQAPAQPGESSEGGAQVDVSSAKLPSAISNVASNTTARPLGQTVVNVQPEREIFVPYHTFDIVENLRITSIINPIAWNTSGATTPSHAQVEALRHAYVGPRSVAGRDSFCKMKVTSVANAFTNARLIIAQVPPIYTREQITAMSVQELSQFNRKEHVLHGGETLIDVEWMKIEPVMPAYDLDSYNGYLVLQVLEYSKSTDSSNPRATIWVTPGSNMSYSIPVAPRKYISPSSFTTVKTNFSLLKTRLLNLIFNTVESSENELQLLIALNALYRDHFKRYHPTLTYPDDEEVVCSLSSIKF